MPGRALSLWKLWPGLVLLLLITSCGAPQPPDPGSTAERGGQPIELVYYSWPEDATSVVFDAFTEETGIAVRHESYGTVQEAVDAIRAGRKIDLAVLESASVPQLIQDGSLAALDFSHIPNFKYISPNFRDLTYDPGNRYSIPYSWGTTGLIVRTDLVEQPFGRWSDLWAPEYAGRVILWTSVPRDTLGVALHALGYSANSEDPGELEEAQARLLELAPHAIWLDDEETSAPWLIDGTAVAAVGWAYDYWAVQEAGVPVAYVLPKEGALLWNDNFVIPASSHNQEAVAALIDFLLRPEIAAQLINANYYPMAHDTARALTDEAIRDDPVIYPESSDLHHAELEMPLTPEGQRLQTEIWQAFVAEIP